MRLRRVRAGEAPGGGPVPRAAGGRRRGAWCHAHRCARIVGATAAPTQPTERAGLDWPIEGWRLESAVIEETAEDGLWRIWRLTFRLPVSPAIAARGDAGIAVEVVVRWAEVLSW